MSQIIDQLKNLSLEQIGITLCFVFILFKKLTLKKRNCPHCKTTLKNKIVPKSIKQFFSGELICHSCNKEIEVDFVGNIKK